MTDAQRKAAAKKAIDATMSQPPGGGGLMAVAQARALRLQQKDVGYDEAWPSLAGPCYKRNTLLKRVEFFAGR